LRYRSDLRAFVVKTGAAFDRLPQFERGVTGSDPLGALQAAAGDMRLEGGTSQHVVVAIFNGWQQSRSLNLFRYGQDPAASTGPALRALRASRAAGAERGGRRDRRFDDRYGAHANERCPTRRAVHVLAFGDRRGSRFAQTLRGRLAGDQPSSLTQRSTADHCERMNTDDALEAEDKAGCASRRIAS
jgi:hypothetical protein